MSGSTSLPIFKSKQDSGASKYRFSKLSLLSLGAVANILIWFLAVLYIKITPKTYTSEWGLNVLEASSGVDVSLPEGWRTSESRESFRGVPSKDPRAEYVFLVQNTGLLEAAATSMELSLVDFGAPEVTTEPSSSIIRFVMEGETPEQAQKKALALNLTLEERIEELRQREVSRRKEDTQKEIDEARQQLEDAQGKLLSHKVQSGLSSDAQIQDLAVGIEQLRRQYAQALAQEKGLESRTQQLARDLSETTNGAAAAYKLLNDPVYQNQFSSYGVVAAEHASLASQLGESHPQLVEKQAEMNGLLQVLQERASFLLGRPVDQLLLNELAVIAQDPSVEISRGSLFQETILGRASQIELRSKTQELLLQIEQLEGRLRILTESKVEADRLEQNLQAKEAFFASSITKLTLNEDDIDSIYPPIQLVTQPTLPEANEFISPNSRMAIVGALAGSFLIVVGIILVWPREIEYDASDNNALADLPFSP
ncbi:MAG: hypothetical protein AAF821_12315 [Cyanobacteria bacterium P01_D01_bin.156]